MQEEERRRAAAEDAAAQHARDADLERRHVAAIIAAHLPAKPTAASVAADGQMRALEEEVGRLRARVGEVEAEEGAWLRVRKELCDANAEVVML